MADAQKVETQVENAPAGIPRGEAERKEWYRSMRERMGQSRFKVSKVPAGYTPYWARVNDRNEMARLDVLGFKVVHDDPAKPRYQANGLREDGTYIMGDVILMECPTEYYEFFKSENLDRAQSMVSGVSQAFINEAAKQKVPAFEVDERNKRKS